MIWWCGEIWYDDIAKYVRKMWTNMIWGRRQICYEDVDKYVVSRYISQTWAGTTWRPLCLCLPTISPQSVSQYSAMQCKYSSVPSDPPNLAQINFGPWELHSVIFPDPPLCLLIPLTANIITDGQEIQKSSWEEILSRGAEEIPFCCKKRYFWPNIPQSWRQVAVTDWIQIWCK